MEDRHDLVEAAAGDHEAADMLREVAREADDLVRQLQHLGDAALVRIEAGALRVLAVDGGARPAPDVAGQRADGVLRQAEGLADLARGGARAIGDDGGGDAGVVVAVFLEDVLDHQLAPLVLEIDVDVGRLVAVARDEALEEQVALIRVHVGDAQAIADGGVGGRAAPLAEDAFCSARTP